MKKPTRLSLLAVSVLALCTASAAVLTAAPAPATNSMCEYGCYGRYTHCLDLGGEEPKCWERYEACLAYYNCP